MSDKQDNPLDVDKAILKNEIRRISKDCDVKIPGPGEDLKIISRPGLDPVVQEGHESYELDDIPLDTGQKILQAIKVHREVIDRLGQSKYLDPATNPMIKTDID